MKITDDHIKTIIEEFNLTHEQMTKSQSAGDKLYFFSATFGIVNRIMNFEPDEILIFIHQVLSLTHQNMQSRLNAQKPNMITSSVPQLFFDKLDRLLVQLTNDIKANDDDKILKTLVQFSVFSYILTGNGFYLMLKDKLSLDKL